MTTMPPTTAPTSKPASTVSKPASTSSKPPASRPTSISSAAPSPRLAPTRSRENLTLTRVLSHGRGGAGNLGPAQPSDAPPLESDVKIPTLKSNVFTTGRGGSGNMAHTADPVAARRAQDVDVCEKELERIRSGEVEEHTGRGGAGNVRRKSSEERRAPEIGVEGEKAEKKERRRSIFERVKEALRGPSQKEAKAQEERHRAAA